MKKPSFLLLLVPLVLALPQGAQTPDRPHWSFSVALGAGGHPDRAGDVYYETSTSNTGLLAIAYRFGSGALRPLLRSELLSEGPGSDWLDCPPAPNGSCLADFPAPDGVGGAAGLTYQLTSGLDASLLAGVGRYDDTRRGFVEAGAAILITTRIAATVAARHMAWDQPGVGRHWYRPVFLGLQANW